MSLQKNIKYVKINIYISGWIFEKVIDGYKSSVPSTPHPPPKLSSPKLLEKWQLSEYPN